MAYQMQKQIAQEPSHQMIFPSPNMVTFGSGPGSASGMLLSSAPARVSQAPMNNVGGPRNPNIQRDSGPPPAPPPPAPGGVNYGAGMQANGPSPRAMYGWSPQINNATWNHPETAVGTGMSGSQRAQIAAGYGHRNAALAGYMASKPPMQRPPMPSPAQQQGLGPPPNALSVANVRGM